MSSGRLAEAAEPSLRGRLPRCFSWDWAMSCQRIQTTLSLLLPFLIYGSFARWRQRWGMIPGALSILIHHRRGQRKGPPAMPVLLLSISNVRAPALAMITCPHPHTVYVPVLGAAAVDSGDPTHSLEDAGCDEQKHAAFAFQI